MARQNQNLHNFDREEAVTLAEVTLAEVTLAEVTLAEVTLAEVTQVEVVAVQEVVAEEIQEVKLEEVVEEKRCYNQDKVLDFHWRRHNVQDNKKSLYYN